MKALAQFVMRGYPQGALVVAASALLSLLLPLFAILSGAALALFTLRRGVREGAILGGLSTLGLGLLSALVLGAPRAALGVLLVLWIPAWGLALVLRYTRSLAAAVLAAGLLGVVLILGIHGLVTDPASHWLALMAPVREALLADAMVDESAVEPLFSAIAQWMTGTFVAALVLQWMTGLFLARWWQAQLYNPGGFGEEFRSLRLHPAVGVAGLVLLTLVGFAKGPGLIPDLLVTLLPLYLMQGLAVVHQLHRARAAHVAWLVGLYGALVLLVPHGALFVACVGLVDIWADLRRRLAPPPQAGV